MSARSSMRQSFNEWMASQGYNDMDDVFLEAKIEEYVRAALSQAERETARLRARNRALEAALGKYDAAYRRVMEQAGKLDSDVWYAVTKAQAFAAALTEPTPPAGEQG